MRIFLFLISFLFYFIAQGQLFNPTSASNLGAGTAFFGQKVGGDLQFKTLTTNSGNISITNSATEVNIGFTTFPTVDGFAVAVLGSDAFTPSSGYINLYSKSAGVFYIKSTAEVEQLAELTSAQTWTAIPNFNAGATVSGTFTVNNGITFPAGATACATNKLCDYEQGTWTPTYYGGSTAGVTTYSLQNGIYTKIGNLVCWSVRITWSAATGTGNVRFGGFPFTILSSTFGATAITYFDAFTITAANTPMFYVIPNTTTATMYQMPSGGGTMANINIDSAADVVFGGCYQTAN